MRVTHSMLHKSALSNLQDNLNRVMIAQKKAATGKRVTRPADDPFAAEQALEFRSRIKMNETSRQNIVMSREWLNATDNALSNLNNMLVRAETLALRGSNETLSEDERNVVAVEVNQVLEEMIAIGNSKHGEHHLFGGFKVNSRPFEATRDPVTDFVTTTTYNGDTGLIQRQVEAGIDVSVNVVGDPLFSDIFNTMVNLRDAILVDPFDADAVAAELTNLQSGMDAVLDSQSAVGTKARRLEATDSRLAEADTTLKSLLSRVEDADMAEVISELNQQQFVYETALAVNGRVLRTSLLDFLR